MPHVMIRRAVTRSSGAHPEQVPAAHFVEIAWWALDSHDLRQPPQAHRVQVGIGLASALRITAQPWEARSALADSRFTAQVHAGGAALKVPESMQQMQQWFAAVWTRGGMCGSSNMQVQVIQQCCGSERNVSSIDALHCHGLARYKKPLKSSRLDDHYAWSLGLW